MANERISHMPALYKWGLPLFVLAVDVWITIAILLDPDADAWLIAVPIVIGIITLILFKIFIWDLADEVFDGGDYLLFRKRGVEQKVAFADIEDIHYLSYTSPRRVTVTCRRSGRLGRKLVFMPSILSSLNPFKTPPMVAGLMERVKSAQAAS